MRAYTYFRRFLDAAGIEHKGKGFGPRMPHYLQKGDYDSGVLYGYQAVISEVAKEYNVDININATGLRFRKPPLHNLLVLSGGR
jgi:hypothetical protein